MRIALTALFCAVFLLKNSYASASDSCVLNAADSSTIRIEISRAEAPTALVSGESLQIHSNQSDFASELRFAGADKLLKIESMVCLNSSEAKVLFSNASELRIYGKSSTYLEMSLVGEPPIMEIRDIGREFYGVWSYPFDAQISNNGVAAPISSLGDRKHLNWSNARAPFFFTEQSVGFYVAPPRSGEVTLFGLSRVDFSAPGKAVVQFEGVENKFFLFKTQTPKAVLSEYNRLAGPQVLPPLWAFGEIWWRTDPHRLLNPGTKTAQESLIEDAKLLQRNRIPATGTILDRPFSATQWGWGSKKFAPTFPDAKRLVSDLDKLGLKTMVWVANRSDGDLLTEGRKQRAFYSDILPHNSPAFDLRNPKGRKILGDYLHYFTELGFSGFKIDRGDEKDVPLRQMNDHSLRLAELAKKSFDSVPGLQMVRSIYDIGRRDQIFWSGDPDATFAGLKYSYLGALRAGLILLPFNGYDTGGYVRSPTKELFLRWLALASHTPLMEVLIDQGGKLFWNWADSETLELSRGFSEEHHRLIPYVYAAMVKSRETGEPIMKPLFLEFPNDKQSREISDEFIYGSSLLVAPVLDPGIAAREVYFPEGRWMDTADWAQSYEGRRTIKAPISRLLSFQKEGSVVIRGNVVQGNQLWTEGKFLPSLEVDLIPLSVGDRPWTLSEKFFDGQKLQNLEVAGKGESLTLIFNALNLPTKLRVRCDSKPVLDADLKLEFDQSRKQATIYLSPELKKLPQRLTIGSCSNASRG